MAQHRRAQILDAVAKLFEPLKQSPEVSGFPIQVKTIQKQYAVWTALDKQGAIPALLVMYGDRGFAPDSDAVGFIDEQFPLSVVAIMKEVRGGKSVSDQASDMHYAVGALFNANRTLGVDGVLSEGTRIVSWRGSEETLHPFLLIKFRVVVVHRYHATENV